MNIKLTYIFLVSIPVVQLYANESDSLKASEYYQIATESYNEAKYEKSIEQYRTALSYYDIIGNWDKKLDCKNRAAGSMLRLGRMEEALSEISDSDLYIDKLSDKGVLADTYNMLGIANFLSSKYEEASVIFRKCRDIRAEVYGENHTDVARANNNVAASLEKIGRYDQCEEIYIEVLGIYEQNDEDHGLPAANTLLNLGNIYQSLGNNDLALEFYERARVIRENKLTKNHPLVGTVFNNIGNVLRAKGEKKSALKYHNYSLKIAIDAFGQDHSDVARSYSNLGNIFLDDKNFIKAKEYQRKALRIREKIFEEEDYYIMSSLEAMAQVYFGLNELDSALYFSQRAITIQRKILGESPFELARGYGILSNIQKAKGDFEESINSLEKSIKIYKEMYGEKSPSLSKIQLMVADRYETLKMHDQNKKFIQYSIASNLDYSYDVKDFYAKPDISKCIDKQSLLSSIMKKIEIFIGDEGDLDYALESFYLCDSLISSIRKSILSNEEKVVFTSVSRNIYAEAIKLSYRLFEKSKSEQYLIAGYYFSEKSRLSSLKENTLRKKANSFSTIPDHLINLEQKLKLDLAFYSSKLLEYEAFNDSIKNAYWEEIGFQTSRRLDSLTSSLELNYPKYYQLKYGSSFVSLDRVQRSIESTENFIEFFMENDSSIYVFLVGKKNMEFFHLRTNSTLRENILNVYYLLENEDVEGFEKASYEIYSQLLKPLNIKSDKLLIIPDGILWNVNFDILVHEYTEAKYFKSISYLINNKTISSAYSSNVFDSKRYISNDLELDECLAFSFNEVSESGIEGQGDLGTIRNMSSSLPGSANEINLLSEVLEGAYFFGKDASESNFKLNASNYNILHLALHGQLDDEDPMNSRLVFAMDSLDVEDNYLYAFEIYGMELNAGLAVLSACNTGSGDLSDGEGLMSLSRAFTYSGCKSIVYSQWEISDFTTPVIMKTFYENLIQNKNKSEALRDAKLSFLEKSDQISSNPLYWASMIQIGDDSPLQEEKNHKFWIITLLALCGISFIYFKKR